MRIIQTMPMGKCRRTSRVYGSVKSGMTDRLFQTVFVSALTCALVVLAGCARSRVTDDTASQPTRDSAKATSRATTYVYECTAKRDFVVRTEGETAWLFLPSQTVRLAQVPSASGTKYSDGLVTLWTKGEEAMLQAGGEIWRNCRNNRAMAIWEDAKLRGVDFRAVGNEPGWNLEISAGSEVVFIGDYGQTEYRFSAPDPSVDKDGRRTTYVVADENHEVVIVLEGRRCQDTMSGESFDTTVTVRLDGDRYAGCGRALH